MNTGHNALQKKLKQCILHSRAELRHPHRAEAFIVQVANKLFPSIWPFFSSLKIFSYPTFLNYSFMLIWAHLFMKKNVMKKEMQVLPNILK